MSDPKTFYKADHVTEQEFLWKALDDIVFTPRSNDFDLEEPDKPLPEYLRSLEKRNIQRALENNNNIIAKAARALGISRERLHHRIKVLEITL